MYVYHTQLLILFVEVSVVALQPQLLNLLFPMQCRSLRYPDELKSWAEQGSYKDSETHNRNIQKRVKARQIHLGGVRTKDNY
jgi:hypothetical protein